MNTSNRSVAIGSTGTQALLALAAKERLLWSSPEDTDKMFETVSRRSVPDPLRIQLLQQLVLSPHVVSTEPHPFFMAGELFEDETVTFRREPSHATCDASALSSFSAEALLGLLDAAGTPLSLEELSERCAFLMREERELSPALEAFGISGGAFANPMSMLSLTVNRQAQAQELFTRWNKWHNLAVSVLRPFEELEETIGLAEAEKLDRLFIPRRHFLEEMTAELINKPDAGLLKEQPEFAVLQVVTTRLGTLPFRTTLRETLELSRTEAAQDLRVLLDKWVQELPAGPTQVLSRIEREAERAMVSLRAGKKLGAVSRFFTYVGVTSLVASSLGRIPPGFGMATTLVGAYYQAASDALSRRFRWASFGNN